MSFSIPTIIYTRLRAVVRYFSDDRSGVVKAQEVACGYTRDTLYRDCHRVVASFHPKPPGPKPDPTRLLLRGVEALERENRVLQAQVRDLNALLCRCVEVTPERIEDPVLTAVTTPPSYAGVGDYVAVAFGGQYRPSVGKVSGMVTRHGRRAGLILTDTGVTDRFDEANLDELFAGRRPVLTVVEPASLAIGAVELSDSRHGKDWQVVLERFRHLRYVASDLGTGLKAGIGLCVQILRHQPDVWHLLVRPLSRITRRLEAGLNKAWDEERQAMAQHQRPKGEGKLYAPSLARIQQTVASHFDRMEQYYQGVETMFEALNPVVDEPGAPRLRTREEARGMLSQALEQLSRVGDAQLDIWRQQVETHRGDLFAFLDQVHDKLSTLPLQGVDDPQQAQRLRQLVLSEILLSQQRQQTADEPVVAAYQHVWQQIARLGDLQKHYPAWREAIAACLYRPRRASSLVETVNSPLRTLQQIHRNLSQPLLDLYALRHNMTPFANGCRRRGQSPYQRLGVDLGTDNWLEALRSCRPTG